MMAVINEDIDLKGLKKAGVDPIVYETYKALKKYKEAPARKEAMQRRDEAWKCAVENEMWEEADKKEMKETGQVPVVYNKLNKGIQGSSAVVTANKPEYKIYPTRNNDPYVAELIKWGLDFVWEKNEGNDVVYDWTEEKSLSGIGWVSAKMDEDKGIFGRIVFTEQEPTIYYFDSTSRDRFFRDTPIIKAQLRTKAYIKENYPEVPEKDLVYEKVDDTAETDTGKLTDTVTGADNYAINPDKSDMDAVVDDEEKREIWEIEAHWLKTEKEWWAWIATASEPEPHPVKLELESGQKPEEVLSMWRQENENPEDPFLLTELWERQMKNRYLRIIVGKAIIKQEQISENGEITEIKERKNPYGLDADGDPVLPDIPLKGQRTRNAYCMSPTIYAIPINRSLNKREAQFLYAASKELNSPVVRTKDSRWTGPPDKPGSEIEISTNTPGELRPYRLPPGSVDLSGIAQMIEYDKGAIDDQYDLPEVMRGKIPKGQENMSGRLGLALQDSASVMNNPHLRALETALIQLAKVLLAIMLRTWSPYMWSRLITSDDAQLWRPEREQTEDIVPGSEEEQRLKAEIKQRWQNALEIVTSGDITLVDLNIKVGAGSSLPTNRMARNAEAREMYKEGLVDRRAALEHSNYPGAKEIAERMDRKEEALAQAGMLKK
jgi:hypothetical protein